MSKVKTVIVELEHPMDSDSLRDYSDEYYGIGRELIRCKDCKWHLPKYPGERPTCLIYAGDWHDYDYCSRAERKEE